MKKLNEIDTAKEILKVAGANVATNGYQYLARGVQYIMQNKHYTVSKVYKELAREFSASSQRVERSIRYVKNNADFNNFFDYQDNITNHTLLVLLTEKTKKVMEGKEKIKNTNINLKNKKSK